MKVTNERIQGTVAARRRGGGAGSAASEVDFAGLIGGGAEAEAAPETAAARAASGLDFLLAAQEVPQGDVERRRHLKRGRAMLDALEAIRLDLIAGVIPKSRLEALAAALARDRATVADPALAGLLDEIELRARVELAKVGLDP